MAIQNGAALQPARVPRDSRAHASRVVSHARVSNTTEHRVPAHPQLGPSHDLHARHAVIWDRDSRAALRIGNALRRFAHTVHVVHQPTALDQCLRHDRPDVLIVDLDAIGAVSTDVFDDAAPPVVGFTSASDPMARARYLDLGADDVVPAPLSLAELEARMRAVLARTRDDDAPMPDTLVCGDLELDASTSRVRVRGEWVDLTALELKLLAFLMRHPAHAFSRETLLDKVWGFSLGDTSTVSVHIRRLRLKLESEPARPVIVRTVWGVGYYLEPPTE